MTTPQNPTPPSPPPQKKLAGNSIAQRTRTRVTSKAALKLLGSGAYDDKLLAERVEEMRRDLGIPTEILARQVGMKAGVFFLKVKCNRSRFTTSELGRIRAYFETQIGRPLPAWPFVSPLESLGIEWALMPLHRRYREKEILHLTPPPTPSKPEEKPAVKVQTVGGEVLS